MFLFEILLSAAPFRAWTEGTGRDVGSTQGDAIRNITGAIGFCSANDGWYVVPAGLTGGAFKISEIKAIVGTPTSIQPTLDNNAYVEFDISRMVPTSADNHPVNIALPIILYLGLPA